MISRTRQNARVAAHVHARMMLERKTPEQRQQLEREWNDTTFDAAYDFTRRWNEGKV